MIRPSRVPRGRVTGRRRRTARAVRRSAGRARRRARARAPKRRRPAFPGGRGPRAGAGGRPRARAAARPCACPSPAAPAPRRSVGQAFAPALEGIGNPTAELDPSFARHRLGRVARRRREPRDLRVRAHCVAQSDILVVECLHGHLHPVTDAVQQRAQVLVVAAEQPGADGPLVHERAEAQRQHGAGLGRLAEDGGVGGEILAAGRGGPLGALAHERGEAALGHLTDRGAGGAHRPARGRRRGPGFDDPVDVEPGAHSSRSRFRRRGRCCAGSFSRSSSS